jgi:tetratricopeptide (TPR) repeat protein
MYRFCCLLEIFILLFFISPVMAEDEYITFSVKAFKTLPASTDIFYGEDVAGALNDVLQGITGLKVFERNANWTFLEELKLNLSGVVENSQNIQQAGIISPDYFIEGEVTLSAEEMVIRSRVYETSSREILYAKTVRGKADNFFDLEDELTGALAEVFTSLDFKTRQIEDNGFERSAYDFYNQSLKNQSVDDRIALLKESLEKEPDFIQALHLLASTYDEAQMRSDCLNTYDRILELDTSDFTARWNLGINAFKLKKYNLAIEAFEYCGILRPEDPEIWYNLGILSEFDESGIRFGPGVDLHKVIPKYIKVLNVEPNHVNATFALGFLYGNLASLSEELEEQKEGIEKAIDLWENFLVIAPEHSQTPEIREHIVVFSQYLDQINQILLETTPMSEENQ